MSLNKKLLRFLQRNVSVFLVLNGVLTVHSKIIDRCDLAIQLMHSDIEQQNVKQWICIAEESSRLNSSLVLNMTDQSDICNHNSLGLFQISNWWCNTPGDPNFGLCTRNGCGIDCLKLLDDDVTDDIDCFKTVLEQDRSHDRSHDSRISIKCLAASFRRNMDWNITECLNSERERKRKLTSVPLWAALLIVAISCSGVFVLTYFFYWYRRNSVNLLSFSEIQQFKYGRASTRRPMLSSPRSSVFIQDAFVDEPYNKEFELTPSQFMINYNKQLGSGAYGIVYRAMCKGKVVAVKTVKPNATKDYFQSLLGEIKILCHVGRHDFIVNLEGAYTKDLYKGTLYVFTEYCALGSLEKFLRNNRNNYVTLEEMQVPHLKNLSESVDEPGATVTFKNLLQYAYQIAKGMEFLASKQVIHSDLAARNILLDDRNVAKITDFGLSRKLYGYIHYIKKKEEPLPWRWMAIESLKVNHFSTASDVWMYGVLLFEVFSLGEVPYPGMSWTLDFAEKLENGFRILKPKYAPLNVYNDVMLKCWEVIPTQRPSFPDLCGYFHHLLHKITAMDYTELIDEENQGHHSNKPDEEDESVDLLLEI